MDTMHGARVMGLIMGAWLRIWLKVRAFAGVAVEGKHF